MEYIIIGVFGVLLGSFLNAWIYRTRTSNLSILRGRSVCARCKKTLRAIDNVPILSFFLLKGLCRWCKKPISKQYPIIEAATSLVFLFIAWHHIKTGMGAIEIVRDSAIAYFLIFVFVYDYLYQEIWDRATTIPALIYIPFALYFSWDTWQSLLLGAVIGAGFFYLQFTLSKGRWVGGGDVRLGFFMGVILGTPKIILALLLAYVIGAFWSVFLILTKRKTIKDVTAFGTYLTLGTFISLLFGEAIIEFYMGLLWLL